MRKPLVALIGVAAALVLALAAAIAYFDGERLRVLMVRYLERNGGLDVEIEGVERSIGLSPRIELEGVRVREPEFGAASLLEVERAAFGIDLPSLLVGPLTLRDVVIDAPEIVLPVADDGVLYWGPTIANLMQRVRGADWAVHGFEVSRLRAQALHTVGDGEATMRIASVEGTMPRVADLTLRIKRIGGELRGRLPIPVPAGGSVEIDEVRLFHTDGELPVRFEVDGRVGARALTVRARGGNALKGEADNRQPLRVSAALAESSMDVEGTISRGADPHVDLRVDIGVEALPAVPAFDARFELFDRDDAWNVEELKLTAGEATLDGHLRVERREPRPLVTGALHAVGVELGSGSRGDGGEQNPPAEQAAQRRDASGPGASLYETVAGELDLLDADVELRAESIALFAVPVAGITARARLSDGRLELSPIDVRVLDGRAEGRLAVAGASNAPPRVELTGELYGLETGELSAALGIDREVFGDLEGRIELESSARRPAELAAAAGGRVTVLMDGGRLSEAVAHLVAMDVAAAILGGLDTDETTPIRCAAADFDGRDGVFEVRTLLVDTGEVKLAGSGSIDLAQNMLDLTIRTYAKDFSPLSADAPVHVTGPLDAPSVAPEGGELAASLLTPIELGGAESVACRQLLEEVGEAARREE